MTTDAETGSTEPATAEPSGRIPTSFPAGTTTLFVLLIASVLATSSTVFFALNYAMPIRWPAEVWMALGLALVFGLAGVHYWLHPRWIRRQGGLRELTLANSRQLVEELHDLCAVARVSPPEFLLAPYATKSVGGLAFGHARRRAVKLDMGLLALRGRSPAAFRAVVLHELAHLRNRDVDLTYFTVAIWRSFVVVVPLMAWLTIRASYQTDSRWWSVAAVAASLLAMTLLVYLTRNALLRARELYADGRVTEWDDAEAGAALRTAFEREAKSAAMDRLIHRVRDDHPHPQRRLEAFDHPDVLMRPRLWQLFAVGVVAAVLLSNGFVFFGITLRQYQNLWMLVVVVPVAVGAVGTLVLAVARTTSLTGGRNTPALLAPPLVLPGGYLVGEATSLVNTASGKWVMFGGFDREFPEAATVLTAACSLAVGCVLVTVWAKSAAASLVLRGRGNRAMVYGLTAAASVAAVPWMLIWWLLRSEVTQSVNAALNRDQRDPIPLPDALPKGYTAVVTWLDGLVSWPRDSLFLMASRFVPGVLVGVVLLWLVPLLLARIPGNPHIAEIRVDVRKTLLISAAGSALCVVMYGVHVLVAKASYEPALHHDQIETWARATLGVLETGSVVIQVVAAVAVVVSTRRLRPILALLAITLVATASGVVYWLGLQPGNCFALVETMVDECWRTMPIESVMTSWHYSVEFGVVAAIPATVAAAGIAALVRRRQSSSAEVRVLPHRRWTGAVGACASIGILLFAGFASIDRWNIFGPAATDDECLVGTWTEVSGSDDYVLRDIVIRMERSGVVWSFLPDGTGRMDFGEGVVESGTYNGHTLTRTYSGKIEYRYQVDDGVVFQDVTHATVSRRLEVDETLVSEKSVSGLSGTSTENQFTCTGNRLRLTQGTAVYELTRLGEE